MKKGAVIYTDIYCMNCGNHSVIPRKTGKQKEPFHRKKFYCYRCKMEVNHIELKNFLQIEEFKSNLEEGAYRNEVKDSVSHVRAQRCW